ncbi:MAG TPA: hypothetical protein VE732_07635 [Nitrososphaera sp.]|nr:hypothetical protein [Nitrososphaera sp.]
MSFQGSTLSYPFRPDQRGTLATVSDRAQIVEQSIRDFVETLKYEHVLLKEYGFGDFVFDVVDASFTARLAFAVEEMLDYIPLLESIEARAGELVNADFIPGFAEDQQRAALSISYTVRGSNSPRNLVFPTWQLRQEAA